MIKASASAAIFRHGLSRMKSAAHTLAKAPKGRHPPEPSVRQMPPLCTHPMQPRCRETSLSTAGIDAGKMKSDNPAIRPRNRIYPAKREQLEDSDKDIEHISIPASPTPVVSVIVPCYNHGEFLADALDSVRAQSWRDWECIVVDDGSTDDTRNVATAFLETDARFKYIHQSNQGLSAARNAGISVCKGSYVQFLDSDDMLQERKLEAQITYLQKHPEIDIVYGNVRYFKEPVALHSSVDESKHRRMPQVSGAGVQILYPLLQRNIMVVNAPLLRKSVINDVDGFDQTLNGYEDWDYWIRCALAGKRFQYVNEVAALALVRVRESSMSQNAFPMLMSRLQVREQLQNISLPSDLCKENGFRIGIILARLAQFEFLNAKPRLGLRHSVLALRYVSANISIRILLQFLALLVPTKITKSVTLAARRLHILP